jgi:nicotinate phosphoribosyltransferase
MWAARAAIAGGLDTTSNVLAALKLGVKPSGTMAHALVMAFTAIEGEEDDAFDAFQRYFPDAALLIDTYDTVAAARRLGEKVRQGKTQVAAVRLDSGDLAELSKQVKEHLPEATILASGDLDEYEIARLKNAGAVIDGYGLGTKLVTGSPVNGVYKLVEIDDIPVMKESNSKTTFPGRKQIFRRFESGLAAEDRLALIDESAQEGERPLLQLVMENGEVIQSLESLEMIAQRAAESVASLPPEVRRLDQPDHYPLRISQPLEELTDRVSRRLTPELSA